MVTTDELPASRHNSAARQLAALIKREREQRWLSQAKLAELAGTNRRNISAYERRKREPRLDEAERVLAGMGLQLRLELEPLSSDVDARIDEISKLTIAERLAKVPFLIPQLMEWLGPGEPMTDGATAIRIHAWRGRCGGKPTSARSPCASSTRSRPI
jgi:transcriptional regulator with XRE-family HTH domain